MACVHQHPVKADRIYAAILELHVKDTDMASRGATVAHVVYVQMDPPTYELFCKLFGSLAR